MGRGRQRRTWLQGGADVVEEMLKLARLRAEFQPSPAVLLAVPSSLLLVQSPAQAQGEIVDAAVNSAIDIVKVCFRACFVVPFLFIIYPLH